MRSRAVINLIFCGVFSFNVLGIPKDFEITCKNENGNSIDWYYLYKLPGQFNDANKDNRQCLYLFISSDSTQQQWILSNRTLNDAESFAGQTLSQAYYDSDVMTQSRFLIAYNDEPPNRKSDPKKGHLKGVVVADDKSGFWLIHSVPLYPNISSDRSEYYYPSTGMIYGQSFLCISLNAKQIDAIGKQLIYNEPQLYEIKFPHSFGGKYPNIERLIQGKKVNDSPFWNEIDLETLDNHVFKSFAKSSKFQKELYEDWIAPALNADLFVETWRKGPGNLASNCSQTTRVWNVSRMNLFNRFNFPTTDDHSKWAVSDEKTEWICVGDINRAMRQMQRGGGSVCHKNKLISDIYRSSIADFEPCKN